MQYPKLFTEILDLLKYNCRQTFFFWQLTLTVADKVKSAVLMNYEVQLISGTRGVMLHGLSLLSSTCNPTCVDGRQSGVTR